MVETASKMPTTLKKEWGRLELCQDVSLAVSSHALGLRPGDTIAMQVPHCLENDAAFGAIGVARPKTPAKLVIVDEFPRTPSGKVQKAELRRQLAQAGTVPPR